MVPELAPLQLVLAVLLVLVVHTPSLGLLLAQLRPLMVAMVVVAVAVGLAVAVVVVVVAAVLVVWAILSVQFPFHGLPVHHWRVPVPVHLHQP